MATSSQRGLLEYNFFELGGLNLYDPDETVDPKKSPYAKNFRLYAPKEADKRVAISKRMGHSAYTVPVGEATHVTQTSTTGAADKNIGLIDYVAMKFTTSGAGNVSRIDLNLKNTTNGSGVVIIELRNNNGGSPGPQILATTSISSSAITGSYQYLTGRFMEAPALANATDYWIVAYLQDDGSNTYQWSSTTTSSLAKTSSNSGASWASAAFSMNYRLYYATSGNVKGLTRYYRSSASPVTVFAHNTNVYSVNDGTGAVTSIKSGLSSNSVYYDFETVNNKLYYANGFDAPRVWDGTTEAASGGSPAISTDVELHANRLWYLSASDSNRLFFSDAAAYETFQSTSFIYIPSPNTKDPALKPVSFQGNMVIFTRNRKWILYGTDLTSLSLKESPAKKGTVSRTAVATDGSFIYFMSDDGLYRYNGGTDQLLSKNVQPIFENAASKADINLQIADNKVFVYYRSSGQAFADNCAVFDINYNDWVHDTNVHIETGIQWTSQSDTGQIIKASSMIGALYYGDSGWSDLGKPIDFEYRTIYHSFGHPSAKHRAKRFYPHLRGQDASFNVDCQVDVDEQDSPISNLVNTSAAAHLYGEPGLLYGQQGLTYGNSTLTPTRITVGGSNRKHQFRFVEAGVDHQVDLLGYTVFVKIRRPI